MPEHSPRPDCAAHVREEEPPTRAPISPNLPPPFVLNIGKMNMKVWLVFSTILWAATIVGPASCEKVQFNVTGCTKNTYRAFLKALQDQLSSGTTIHDIPLMRAPSGAQEFLLVEIFNWSEDPITLVVNLINAYVVAYEAQNKYYLLADTPDNPQLYGNNLYRLSFEGSYTCLQRVAGANRKNIDLGIKEIAAIVLTLYYWNSDQDQSSVARSLIVLIQMVYEAARFKYIEIRVRQSITNGGYSNFRPDALMISIQTNWKSLSVAVQRSNGGAFDPPVPLKIGKGTQYISNINTAVKLCALLLNSCNAGQSQALLSSYDSCEQAEPIVRISGRSGHCMDVKGGFYNNGDPIILWPCKDNDNLNQLWKFKRDGTIQSNGKCLAASGDTVGSYVMIQDCSSSILVNWMMVSGSIINRISGLSIGVESDNIGTELIMHTDISASKQAWLPSNDTRPFLTPIIGLDDLCMHRFGDYVDLNECDDNNPQQKWYIYGDGSIRPSTDTSLCVTCQSDVELSRIVLLSCDLGNNRQRWMFTFEGYIYNMHNGMVVDVTEGEIIMWRPTVNPNQVWFTSFRYY